MPSVQEEREIRQINRSLASQGVEGNFDLTLNEKRQWYRADGTPLPNLLPTDEYNRAVFQSRGWTLTPPREPVEPQPKGLSPIEQEIQKAREKALAKAQGRGASPIEREVQRETAGVVRDRMAAETPETETTGFNFLEPNYTLTVHGKSGDGLCLCGWKSESPKKNRRQFSLNRHLKEKQDG